MIANIDIYDAQNRPALQLKKTDVTFSWLSIPLLEPHLANLVIREPELTIRRKPQRRNLYCRHQHGRSIET